MSEEPSVRSICDLVGRSVIAASAGVPLTAVSNAIAAGTFPARWYAVVKAECDARGLECPTRLFRFVGALDGVSVSRGASA